MAKNKKITIDDLAGMVAKGFNDMDEKIEGLRSDMKEMKKDMNELKSDMEDVKIGLGHRVHIFEHRDLEFRVERLEEKTGINKRK